MSLLINAIGLALIGAIIAWFWLWKPKAITHAESAVVDILVDQGVYTPARIEIPQGRATRLRFLRKDPSPCAEKVLIDDLDLSLDLPLNQRQELVVKPEQTGTFEFTCQMRMYRGELLVR